MKLVSVVSLENMSTVVVSSPTITTYAMTPLFDTKRSCSQIGNLLLPALLLISFGTKSCPLLAARIWSTTALATFSAGSKTTPFALSGSSKSLVIPVECQPGWTDVILIVRPFLIVVSSSFRKPARSVSNAYVAESVSTSTHPRAVRARRPWSRNSPPDLARRQMRPCSPW